MAIVVSLKCLRILKAMLITIRFAILQISAVNLLCLKKKCFFLTLIMPELKK